jgi:hypothetical protein
MRSESELFTELCKGEIGLIVKRRLGETSSTIIGGIYSNIFSTLEILFSCDIKISEISRSLILPYDGYFTCHYT